MQQFVVKKILPLSTVVNFFLFFFCLLASLSAQEIRRAIPVHPFPLYAAFDENALLLAGRPLPLTSSLASLQFSKGYQSHRLAMEKVWSNYDERQFMPMREWSCQELPSRMPKASVIYYFFGGPDILSPLALFPEASTYLLCGKEPVGSMPLPEQFSEEQLQRALLALRNATQTALQYGYFITKEMRTQITEGPFQGVTPLLVTFLSLIGYKIKEVEKITLGGAPAVRIGFVTTKGAEKTVYYAQQDLSNDGSSRFLRCLQGWESGISYLKAASYLLHEESFSRARKFLLSHSDAILEDDSGIPLHCFEDSQWTLYLFGNYKGPIELFRNKYQEDLYNAYHTSLLAGPMNFGTGYQFQAGPSGGAHLILAVRRSFAPKAVMVEKNHGSKKKDNYYRPIDR